MEAYGAIEPPETAVRTCYVDEVGSSGVRNGGQAPARTDVLGRGEADVVTPAAFRRPIARNHGLGPAGGTAGFGPIFGRAIRGHHGKVFG